MAAPVIRPRRSEAGLSLVEFLVAAFILAIGLLGLALLQAFSLRVTAQEVGNNRAALIAEGLLDEIQAKARTRNLQAQVESQVDPAAAGDPVAPLFTGGASVCYYSAEGARLGGESGAYYRVALRRTALSEAAMPLPGLSRFEVEVTYTADVVGAQGATKPITRTVLLSRKVSHV